jgi:hypothetical protein
MDLFIRVLMVLPLAGANLKLMGIGTNIDLLENRVCSGHFHFYYLFVKFTHHEKLKPTTVAFLFISTCICNICYWLRQG